MQTSLHFSLFLSMERLLCVTDLQDLLGLGRSAIYTLIHNPAFPAPIIINARTLRWEQSDIEEWLISKKNPLKTNKIKTYTPRGQVVVVNGVRFRMGDK